jgi:hypothetical protein
MLLIEVRIDDPKLLADDCRPGAGHEVAQP